MNRRFKVILAFTLVYIFWGSTYLGLRIAVERIPAILIAGTRFTIAGTVMLVFCRLSGRKIALTLDQFWRLAFIGVLLLAISNATLAWSELYVPTGLAALIVSITPIWFLGLDYLLIRRATAQQSPIGKAAILGVALGLAGMVVLLWPQLRQTQKLGTWEGIAAVCLIGGSFAWAFGSVLSRKWHVDVDAFVGSGWEMLIAGLVDLAVAYPLGDYQVAKWDGPGIAAILYLVVFGSWVGYSAYIWLLHNVPPAKVSTYAYVNPIVAVILGWLVLGESVDRYMFFGAAVIVPAVALVTTAEHDLEPAD